MGSIAETVAEAKTGVWQRLATTVGLTVADGVTVRSATIAPEEFEADMVILGDVTISAGARPGLAGRAANPTMNGWVIITRPEGDEAAMRSARDRAAAVMGLVEAAVMADPTADGTIAGPGGTTVSVSALEESPVDLGGQAARRATYPFSISWTSHLT
jgi:hypothetical protein